MRVAVIAGNFDDPVGRNLEGYENQHWGMVMKIAKTKRNNSGVFWSNEHGSREYTHQEEKSSSHLWDWSIQKPGW